MNWAAYVYISLVIISFVLLYVFYNQNAKMEVVKDEKVSVFVVAINGGYKR